MSLDYQTMIRLMSQFIWPMVRIGGLMLTVPVLSSALLPARIKILFVFTLSCVCFTYVPYNLSFENFNGLYPVYLVQELLLGLLMGFVLQIVFQVFILGGQIISMQAGLGFAVMVDPTSNASVPLISQLYLMVTTLIFLALNGHLAILETLIESFRIMPIGKSSLDPSIVWSTIMFSGWMFKEAVLISIPAILSLLIVSLSFGVMARVAPQLNLFSLGFPITLLMGFVIIKIGLPTVGTEMVESIKHGIQFITGILR
ncbi:TPA: flagellar biosynthetic protein FliR [Legionella pneumophila]|uniref:flagellar biosynthetic protein FliR n=1 Tax=Legionella sp. PATHC039 TaxID=2992042 RepID=UPI0007783631|nr:MULTISPECIES: flagellar biosynthetic protein FliR [Legionella]HAT8857441.1 flagellar biosynthetic protein FliR [Legionella pneumophila subsp. pneumophila]MCW8394754.1 flagellar biosynthetic protein FliR [Legionella sp. PATHC039]HAT7071885.1 flagellar biosynthetic protein FliR [Legionella pneumophila]HAT8640305.1 flagellar biosynthetic protein FliR [Legionella pneumophila]HAT8866985.1 flagellar biosynthetic protein FliR [Legionella pneumophila subsp. pneumophila]